MVRKILQRADKRSVTWAHQTQRHDWNLKSSSALSFHLVESGDAAQEKIPRSAWLGAWLMTVRQHHPPIQCQSQALWSSSAGLPPPNLTGPIPQKNFPERGELWDMKKEKWCLVHVWHATSILHHGNAKKGVFLYSCVHKRRDEDGSNPKSAKAISSTGESWIFVVQSGGEDHEADHSLGPTEGRYQGTLWEASFMVAVHWLLLLCTVGSPHTNLLGQRMVLLIQITPANKKKNNCILAASESMNEYGMVHDRE